MGEDAQDRWPPAMRGRLNSPASDHSYPNHCPPHPGGKTALALSIVNHQRVSISAQLLNDPFFLAVLSETAWPVYSAADTYLRADKPPARMWMAAVDDRSGNGTVHRRARQLPVKSLSS